MGIPVFDVDGSPAERGESYGRQAGSLIARAVTHYRQDFAAKGVDWDEACEIARKYWRAISDFDAQLAQETETLSRASGQPLEAIVLLNARTEILFWRESRKGGALQDAVEVEGCTSALAMPEATAEGSLIHGQNWDWTPEAADHTMALRVRGADAPDALHFVEAGQLARHGVNAAGIAVTAMGLHSAGDYGRIGVPSPLIRRRILESATFADAIRVLFEHRASFPHALIVSHCDGEAFCFETTPDETFWLEPEGGVLAHANHFAHPAAIARIEDVNLARCPDSLYRDARLRRQLKAERGRITVDSFKRCLGDEFGAPHGILRRPSARPNGLVSATVYTLIMAPAKGAAHLALRPYETNAFQEISIK